MRLKSFFLALFACTFTLSVTAYAQNSRQILDNTAKRLNGKTLQATFKASTFTNKSQNGSANGQIYVKNNKFHIITQPLITWFDGKTLWQYVKSSGEVNVSNPTTAELQKMNPYVFINLYKKGYNLRSKTTTLRGKSCYEVTLTAQNKNAAIPMMIITIDKNYSPLCIRIKNGKQWTRLSIYNLKTGIRMNDSQFKFNSADYPEAQIIDLR